MNEKLIGFELVKREDVERLWEFGRKFLVNAQVKDDFQQMKNIVRQSLPPPELINVGPLGNTQDLSTKVIVLQWALSQLQVLTQTVLFTFSYPACTMILVESSFMEFEMHWRFILSLLMQLTFSLRLMAIFQEIAASDPSW